MKKFALLFVFICCTAMLLNADGSPQNVTRKFPSPLRQVCCALGLPWMLPRAFGWADVYGAGITLAVAAAFFWKRATTAGGLSSICAGTLVAVAWKIARFSSPMIFPALAASLACLIGVSLLTAPPREEQWRPFFKDQG